MHKPSWSTLQDSSKTPIAVAVDTEFEGDKTLTIQFATRVGQTVYVQIYYAAGVAPPRPRWFDDAFAEAFAGKAVAVKVRPAKPITASLSLALVLADLLALGPCKSLSRAAGRIELAATGSGTDTSVHVILVGHYLPADLLRAFGSDFYAGLLLPGEDGRPEVNLRKTRVIGLAGAGAEKFRSPVVEVVQAGGTLLPLRLNTFDTSVAFGPGRLDDLARAFVGIAKAGDLSDEDKASMTATFRTKPREAYRYAAADPVLTLLLAERMEVLHRELYGGLGFAAADIPPCHKTPGVRVSNLLQRLVGRGDWPGVSGGRAASLEETKTLFESGGGAAIGHPANSRYGMQLGQTHGGLLLPRSPTRFCSKAPGMFRDVDFSSCYPSILGKMNVYAGRPVVWEPGNEALTLEQVIALLETGAAGWDAWFVTVTGKLTAAPNALIPSPDDALTHLNFKCKTSRRRAQERHDRQSGGGRHGGAKALGYTSIFTDEVSAGVVVWATWQIIKALPPDVRAEYEQLRVESVVFYPKAFVADSWTDLDALRARLATGNPLDWSQRLDVATNTRVTVDELDEKYAALKYPIGGLATHLKAQRQAARRPTGSGSPQDRMFKLVANTLYGALCSPHLPTQNVVAAQVVTGTARAIAYALSMSMNAHTVITDGGIYRKDQIPAGTFAECLGSHPDYPIRRPEVDHAFLDRRTCRPTTRRSPRGTSATSCGFSGSGAGLRVPVRAPPDGAQVRWWDGRYPRSTACASTGRPTMPS